MKTANEAETTVCWASAPIFDPAPELLVPFALLLAVLAAGGVALWLAFRWYRKWSQPLSTADDDFAQLTQALQQQNGLNPQEIERVRTAIEKKKEQGA